MSNARGLFGITTGRELSLMARQTLYSGRWGCFNNFLASGHAPLPVPDSAVIYCLPLEQVAVNKVVIKKLNVQEQRGKREKRK